MRDEHGSLATRILPTRSLTTRSLTTRTLPARTLPARERPVGTLGAVGSPVADTPSPVAGSVAGPVAGSPGPARWRRPTAVAIGVVGVGLYNWWVVVAASGRLLTTPDELFSDLEATGRPDASLLQHLDLAAGLVLMAALLVRGRRGPAGRRAEWPWMLAFAAAGAVGGRFAYACPEGLSAACRSAEWRLALPPHHYVHVVAGIVEFATATVAVYIAWHRTRAVERPVTRVVRWTGRTMVAAYPLLAWSYLTDRMGAFVEPVFFVAFTAMVLAELCETDRPMARAGGDHRFVRLVPAARPAGAGQVHASARPARAQGAGGHGAGGVGAGDRGGA